MSVDDSSSSFLTSVSSILLRLGTVFVGVVAVAGGLLYVKQDSLLYFPEIGGIPRRPANNPRGYRSPEERQIPFEDCQIVCRDGVAIHAWLLLHTTDGQKVPPNTPTIIFFHGNAGNIGLRLPNAIQMRQYTSANILMVEYRGYGNSDTVTPSEAGLRLDAEAALHWALDHEKIDNDRIFLFGRSLGGAVAMHLADYAERKNIPLAGVMVENTFTSISAMVDVLMPALTPIKPLVLKIGWDSTRIVPSITTPLLYLAGSRDELVPHGHMQELVRLSANSRLVLVHIIEGGTHNESWLQGGAAYWDAMANFMQRAMHHDVSRITQSSYSAAQDSSGSAIPLMPSRFVDIAKDAAGLARTTTTSKSSSSSNKKQS